MHVRRTTVLIWHNCNWHYSLWLCVRVLFLVCFWRLCLKINHARPLYLCLYMTQPWQQLHHVTICPCVFLVLFLSWNWLCTSVVQLFSYGTTATDTTASAFLCECDFCFVFDVCVLKLSVRLHVCLKINHACPSYLCTYMAQPWQKRHFTCWKSTWKPRWFIFSAISRHTTHFVTRWLFSLSLCSS